MIRIKFVCQWYDTTLQFSPSSAVADPETKMKGGLVQKILFNNLATLIYTIFKKESVDTNFV